MNFIKQLFFTVLLLTGSLQLFAQNETVSDLKLSIDKKTYNKNSLKGGNEEKKPNFLKLNLTGIALKNYSVQFERILGKKFSAAISFRLMPNTALPFKGQITKSIGTISPNTTDLINSLEISNFAVTPEFRMYLSKKGYGHGFYIAPFYRFALYKTNSLKVNFTGDGGTRNSVNLSGDLTSNTAGILFGVQWTVGKQMCIDWSIAGPHYGAGKGSFSGVTSTALSQNEQDELYRQVDKLIVPFSRKTVHVDASGAAMGLSGPWAGIRAALSFGLKF